MSDEYVAIKGWAATVESITPKKTKNKVVYLVGKMSLLPSVENRTIRLDSQDVSLDVFFHCFQEETAFCFHRDIKKGDTLFVSGDLSSRDWQHDPSQPTTNFWLDEYFKDPSKHTVSSLVGKVIISDREEYFSAANSRYHEKCVHCGGKTLYVEEEYSDKRYCKVCDD